MRERRAEARERDPTDCLGVLRRRVAYIDADKASFGVEPSCRVLRQHEYKIAPSTCYSLKSRQPSARSLSDERLLVEMGGVCYANDACYGVRKVWQALWHRQVAVGVGRDQVARLMRLAGLLGRTRLKRVRRAYVASHHPVWKG